VKTRVAGSRRKSGEADVRGVQNERIPLVRRFPKLASIPRVALTHPFTPVEHVASISPNLWIKRDDLCADPLGGNKVRALEFLLAGLHEDDRVVTVGSAGSTHALAVATHAARLRARVLVGRWKQEMNPSATRIAERTSRVASESPVFASPVFAYAWAMTQHLRGARWIAAGGSTPLGVLGHVNAALELIDQIDAGALPGPAAVVVPLGTGGTAAGLALGFAIARRDITVVGVRVVPRVVARQGHVLRLATRTARLIERVAGESVQHVKRTALVVAHEQYGGAYGRETPAARDAVEVARLAASVGLDTTYSAKAFAFARQAAERGPTLFWLTFDSRSLDAR